MADESGPPISSLVQKLIFPGVGSFSQAISSLHSKNLFTPLQAYLSSGRPYFGICIGMQVLFNGSDEGEPIPGLGIVDARVERFKGVDEGGKKKAVPHMGWNEATPFETSTSPAKGSEGSTDHPDSQLITSNPDPSSSSSAAGSSSEDLYFVHSYAVPYRPTPALSSWTHTTTQYGRETFVSSVRRGNILGCQFHPEKSGQAGLKILERWLAAPIEEISGDAMKELGEAKEVKLKEVDGFTKRIVACLDVRTNDQGQFVSCLVLLSALVLSCCSERKLTSLIALDGDR
jgi:glutamine amidotransferase/cyclase